MKKHFQIKWLGVLAVLFLALIPQMKAQEVDDLQEYLDQLASGQTESQVQNGPRKAGSVEIPVGLTEVDLSKFTSYQNRTKTVTVKANVKFTNGTISAASTYSGGTCLLKVYGGATVVLDATAGVDASAASSSNCLAAVGIYEGSTFYECGDITAPDNGEGIAIYKDTKNDTYIYVSGTRRGSIYPDIPIDELLAEIKVKLDDINTILNDFYDECKKLDGDIIPDIIRQVVDKEKARLGTLTTAYDESLATYNALLGLVQAMTGDDDGTLYNQAIALKDRVTTIYEQIQVEVPRSIETIKAFAAEDLTQKLTAMAEETNALQTQWPTQNERIIVLRNQIGNYYFMRKGTENFDSYTSMTLDEIEANAHSISIFINGDNGYNALLNNHYIATIDDVITFYTCYATLFEQLANIKDEASKIEVEIEEAVALFNTLEVNFPNEEMAFTIRPTKLEKELQLGYKSNRGFVLTSAGMMWFEQKEGADFYLTDAEGNYIVATSGSTTLRAGTKAEATVWTGQSIGNGNYTFYSKALGRYLAYSGINVNNAIIAGTQAYAWTITESELDDLQAFLNLLAEEETNPGEDTLDIVMPNIDPNRPIDKEIVFPKTIIHILPPSGGGYWPIPRPEPDQPCPKDFHPYYIPKGSHVIMDDVTFSDLIGGDHIIYVEGTIEINITVNIYITNWLWFIYVGPGGHVIWRPTGGEGAPRIKNKGTMDIESGTLDYVENYGTVNHNGGDILTASNFEGGTYTMRGGTIRNTVVNETDTVFVNRGIFYFYGGLIGGYGSRLIYHGPGATMYIDGGHFEFTYIKHYWIEAHADYYIRGDYDYGATVPMLLGPSVTIRILYKWIYKFNIVFIDGRPTPRYPLFWAEAKDFKFDSSYFIYIDWQLPNKRWRWYIDEEENTIEPRDEAVEDEDDLQAYLDWLANNQDGEAASTEEEPQVLDLKGHDIAITKPVVWPTGCHVYIKNGHFTPSTSWTYNYIFYIPAKTTVRYEYVTIDVSSSNFYLNGAQRNIFEVYGNFYFGIGCHVKGYVSSFWEATDTNIPGAVVYIDPAARFFLDGGRIENVIFRVNTVVNIYVTQTIVNNIYVYIPTACRYDGFGFMAPFGNYQFTLADLRKVILWKCDSWSVKVLPNNGYMALFDIATPKITKVSGEHIGVDTQVELSCATAGAIIYYTIDGSDPRTNIEGRKEYNGKSIKVDLYNIVKAVAVIPGIMGESNIATFIFGDLNDDGKVDIADGVTVLNMMAADKYDLLADFNNDNKVDIADFVTILNIMSAQ